MSPTIEYCGQFRRSGMKPIEFALAMISIKPDLCKQVMEVIGCWPSSEVELNALQRVY